ncbi:MAG: nitrate reductase [Deltaproteobacteria bacterium RIFOXYA12_FULL_58_15]|nr:MAG: nitrate reductase [Deltaproteobacteria bacterium RIFOXYA12_FULL_58_15]OGR13755.1 MAG: nitrate reductase [Deltaproteobacteria bacterium RIFOXYB12_FULL_58_9]
MDIYEVVRGPLVWIAFLGLAGGVVVKLLLMASLAKKEKTVFPTMSASHGLRSILHWIMPWGSTNMRAWPVMTTVSFAFHLCLLVTPLFVMGHAVSWQQSWGISWWSLPALAADIMTLWVVCGGVFFLIRRLTAPEVRNVTTFKDVLLILLVISPYLTAFVAHEQWFNNDVMIVLHIVTGVLWMLAIPFTWLSHMFWFVFTRAYMGSEFGAVRNARDW